MEVLKIIISALVGAIGGGGILGFVQFMISRKDNKGNELKEIRDDIKSLAKKVDGMETRMQENTTTNARVRILRFSDELMQNVWHSKDSFDQAILDCDTYEEYCDKHPDYKNSIAGAAVEYIRKTYQKCIEEHSFLS